MSLAPGVRLGAYEVASLIGSGGMGDVYRAHDTKLCRDVALKMLPESVVHDPDRVARFRREAQVLASLNHPHIAAIYGLEEANGLQFLILELVEGETLTQRLKGRALPVDEALTVARQIADALEAAHEKGIIHRDLKPANIAFTADSQVKVLDFGLAKALDPVVGSDLSNSPTLTLAATQAGVILGTAAYMAPEQAKGRPADKRSDVWAFGCVLYEMLTGRRAFKGEDVSDTLAFILTQQPDWDALPATTPVAIRRLLRRCSEIAAPVPGEGSQATARRCGGYAAGDRGCADGADSRGVARGGAASSECAAHRVRDCRRCARGHAGDVDADAARAAGARSRRAVRHPDTGRGVASHRC